MKSYFCAIVNSYLKLEKKLPCVPLMYVVLATLMLVELLAGLYQIQTFEKIPITIQ